ncbi:MAG TPA: penicillin-binding protein 2 [Egibacteraceae bacterium]|nr:penicillin-binding protein 2 [Egibacteraceae bacterium]
MIRPLRSVSLLMLALFGALFVNLNYLQVVRARDLASDPRNSRGLIEEYEIRRGAIFAADETTQIAHSEETEGLLRFQRIYDDGPLYAHVSGFYSFIYGRSQLELAMNSYLVGSAPEVFARNLADLLSGQERRGDVVITTIRPDVQRAAAEALGDRAGAVVALNPRSGEILALVSSPSYDPNVLASHERSVVVDYWEQTESDPANPRLSRAANELYPPGSTFKLVTAAAALEAGMTPEEEFGDPPALDLPQTDAAIRNFGGGLCNGGQPITLRRALEMSCNTTFGAIGLELGSEALIAKAEDFGLNREWEFQLPHATSRIPKELDPPQTAQSAIGQRDVRVTPLQMAMITAAIANDGVLVTPRVVAKVEDFAGRIIRQFPPGEPLRLPGASDAQAVDRLAAAALRDMMVGVVQSGSGQRAAIDGVTVAGKTGTAQTGEGRPPTVWFVGFAPVEDPQVAVAVVVEDGGDVGDEATGGRVAAPIARAALQAALAPQE